MHTIKVNSLTDAWLDSHRYLLENGNREVMNESINMSVEIEDNFNINPDFDSLFRKTFGDDRIDYAGSVTFVKPTPHSFIDGLQYQQNDTSAKWNKTYWGRMINWGNNFNQIEQTIKRLKEHKNSKTIAMSIYDPKSDGKKTMGGMPCLLSVDLKPRKEGLYLTAFFRSMRISKSGYADWFALCELGKFLCEQADLKLKRITTIGGSVHLGDMNNEKKNVKELLNVWNSMYSK
jgi:thymidylate synthase